MLHLLKPTNHCHSYTVCEETVFVYIKDIKFTAVSQ